MHICIPMVYVKYLYVHVHAELAANGSHKRLGSNGMKVAETSTDPAATKG